MPRTPLIAGNWKMYKTADEARTLGAEVRDAAGGAEGVDVLVCPPFTALPAVAEELAGSSVLLGAQNVFYEESGAFTGEISPPMLAALGVVYVIVGHSERRQYFGDTDEIVNKKVRAALAHGLKPILCLGEKLEEREAGEGWKDLIRSRLSSGLEGVSAAEMARVTVAYEPVWAIGTGKTATPAMAAEAHGLLRNAVAAKFGADVAARLRILYGGSVKPDNVKDLMAEEEIDGALVGGASLKAETFAPLIRFRE
jgi:triosephosphate isomerase